jgi:hypothetical protein
MSSLSSTVLPDLEADDFRTLADQVLEMMRSYKIGLENAASMATYRRPLPMVQQ